MCPEQPAYRFIMASVFLNIPVPNTAKSQLESSARHSTCLLYTSRFWLKPNLLQCHSSYVVTDPNGSIVVERGNALLKNGYKVRILNTIDVYKRQILTLSIPGASGSSLRNIFIRHWR